MTIRRFLFLSFPFFVFPIATYNSSWFIFCNNTYIYTITSITYFFFIYLYFTKEKLFPFKQDKDKILSIIILLIFVALFILFPVRNLNLGDGILLIENVFIETGLFSYQLTLDELLEAMSHSVFFYFLSKNFPDPRISYQILSTLSGIIFLIFLWKFFQKKKFNFITLFFVISSGGMILFFGYSENYTITSLILLFFITTSINSISQNKKNLPALILPTIIASIAILFHLVSGHLIFPLIYLWWITSEKNEFIKNALISTLIGVSIILPFFIYFTFFSEVRVDMSQTHIAHPPFYPLSKIISTKHFMEIFTCIFLTCFFPFVYLADSFLFQKEKIVKLKTNKEFIFLLVTIFAFFINAFTHHPVLGFPADWDLMSFYWIPISIAAVYVYNEFNSSQIYIFPLLFLSLFILLGNIFNLSKPIESKELELKNSLFIADKYIKQKKDQINKMEPNRKKFYFKTDYFLFKAENQLTQIDDKVMLNDVKNFRIELNENITELKPDWQKDYINRLTVFHIKYLQLIKNK